MIKWLKKLFCKKPSDFALVLRNVPKEVIIRIENINMGGGGGGSGKTFTQQEVNKIIAKEIKRNGNNENK